MRQALGGKAAAVKASMNTTSEPKKPNWLQVWLLPPNPYGCDVMWFY
jgi:hypothetical protein